MEELDMSLKDGMAAINLEMPSRVPHTEYSLEFHWDLLTYIMGRPINSKSSREDKREANNQLRKLWNFDFLWATDVYVEAFNGIDTYMGHAVYMTDNEDYNNQTRTAFEDPEDVLNFDPWEKIGPKDKNELIHFFNRNYRRKCEVYPDAVNMTGVYVTCISGLIGLYGWEMLLEACGTDQKRFGEMTNRYASWIQQYFDALAASDTPVVMVHDDICWTSGAIFDPVWYRKYVFPNYVKYFEPMLAAGKKIIYTSDGNYTMFLDDIVKTGVHGFVMEPLTDMAYFADKYGKTHSFVGNADTRILLSGTKDDIYREVKRCMDIGKKYPGYFLAVGNHIPPNTPLDSVLYYEDCYEKMSKR
jgi:hypothetical protein